MRFRTGAIAVVLLLLLSAAAVGLRHESATGCALDGVAIDPLYRVQVVDAKHQTQQFCCLRCAELWLKRQAARPKAIHVTDETTGELLNASEAHYVRSLVVTSPATGNRIHAFGTRESAVQHANMFRGTLLVGNEQPFAGPLMILEPAPPVVPQNDADPKLAPPDWSAPVESRGPVVTDG